MLGVTLLSTLAIVGGGVAISGHATETFAPVEVDAASYPFIYELIDVSTSQTVTNGTVTDNGTGGEFTVTLSKDSSYKLQVTDSDETTFQIGYDSCISEGQYSAFFTKSDATSGAAKGSYVCQIAGEYTFTFEAGWGVYGNDKHVGLTIATPSASTRTLTINRIFPFTEGETTRNDYLPAVAKSVIYYGENNPTYTDFQPDAVYGFTFEGFYSDAALTTSIGSTEQVTADTTVWAKYSPVSGAVTYTVDYSAAMNTGFEKGFTLAYRGYDSNGQIAYPGIRIASTEANGTISFKLPAGATYVALNALEGQNNVRGQAKITPADADSTAVLADGGTLNTNGVYVVDTFTPDAAYTNIYNALKGVADKCGDTAGSASTPEAITTAWSTIDTNKGTSAADYLKAMPAVVDTNGDHVDGIAGLLSVYDYVNGKYSLSNPLGRDTASAGGNSSAAYLNTLGENADSYIAIIAVIGAVALTGGAFVFFRKRKGQKA